MSYSPASIHPLVRAITIGRRSSCDIVVDSPLVSGVHCKVKISKLPDPTVTRILVNDCSRNGTWVERRGSDYAYGAAKPGSGVGPGVEKISNAEPKDISVDDTLMLVAPTYDVKAQYRYKLIREDGKYFLQHLCLYPEKIETEPEGRKREACLKRTVGDFKDVCPKGTEGERRDVCPKGTEEGGKVTYLKEGKGDTSPNMTEGEKRDVHPKGTEVDSIATGCKRTGEISSGPPHKKAKRTSNGNTSLECAAPTTREVIIESKSSNTEELCPVSSSTEPEEMARCPLCRKLFNLSYLPIHSPVCQEVGRKEVELTMRDCPEPVMEECSNCKEIFASDRLCAHLEVCGDGDIKRNRDSYGECPYCSAVLPVLDLIDHSAACGKSRLPKPPSVVATGVVEVDGARNLRDEDVVLEQCPFCLENFPKCETSSHYSLCTSKTKVCVQVRTYVCSRADSWTVCEFLPDLSLLHFSGCWGCCACANWSLGYETPF